MTLKFSFIAVVTVALVFAVPAFGDSWGADQDQATVSVSPDVADRIAAARQQDLSSILDARERSFAAKRTATTVAAADPYATIARLDPSSGAPAPRSARLTTSNGCRLGSDSASAYCSQSDSFSRCGSPGSASRRADRFTRWPLGAASGAAEGGLRCLVVRSRAPARPVP